MVFNSTNSHYKLGSILRQVCCRFGGNQSPNSSESQRGSVRKTVRATYR